MTMTTTTTPTTTMRAARLHVRGGPEQVVVEQAPLPVPPAGEVRIRVRACALTPGELAWDETYRHPDGSPRFPAIPGHDVAGEIDVLGAGVAGWQRGEAVYGLINFPRDGSAAEYVCAPAAEIARMPRSIDALHAAAVPLSGLTAWQGLFDQGKLQKGQRVLIHGGSGGVGAYAVQLAHHFGARVITTASAANIEAVRALGAAEVIDYAHSRFDELVRDVDLVFDTIGGETLTRSLAVVRPGGRVVSIAGKPDPERAAARQITAIFFIVHPEQSQLQQLAALVDAGNLQVQIEATYPLSEARAAFERSVGGHLRGKVVLQIQ